MWDTHVIRRLNCKLKYPRLLEATKDFVIVTLQATAAYDTLACRHKLLMEVSFQKPN